MQAELCVMGSQGVGLLWLDGACSQCSLTSADHLSGPAQGTNTASGPSMVLIPGDKLCTCHDRGTATGIYHRDITWALGPERASVSGTQACEVWWRGSGR